MLDFRRIRLLYMHVNDNILCKYTIMAYLRQSIIIQWKGELKTVAEMIKKTRTEANMTQGEYGAKFGVSRQTVSSWENGRSLPDLQMLIDICNTYHVSLDKLLNEDKEFVEKIDFYNKYKKAIRLVGMCLLAGLLIFAIVFINWKITERNMNQAFEMNAEKLGS